MSDLPTPTAATHLIDALGELSRRPRRAGITAANSTDQTTLDSIRRRLIGTKERPGALRREAHGTNLPDGYPSRTIGDGGRGQSELTPVEAAAAGRIKPPRDEHRDLTRRAVDALDVAVHKLNVVMAALASLDDLCGDGRPEPRTCNGCHPWREIIATVTRPNTSVGGRLAEAADLCGDCYTFVRWTAEANTEDGRLPNADEVEHHRQRGRWPRRKVAA